MSVSWVNMKDPRRHDMSHRQDDFARIITSCQLDVEVRQRSYEKGLRAACICTRHRYVYLCERQLGWISAMN